MTEPLSELNEQYHCWTCGEWKTDISVEMCNTREHSVTTFYRKDDVQLKLLDELLSLIDRLHDPESKKTVIDFKEELLPKEKS